MIREIVETIRKPEHTGENRCPPCTVVNLIIAATIGALVSRKSRRAGVLTVVASVGVIYLRGYLVPGTPALTKRYLPPTVLEWFGKSQDFDLATGVAGGEPIETDADRNGRGVADSASDEPTPTLAADGSADDSDRPTIPTDLERYFVDAGLLEPCDDRDDLCLTEDFESAWVDAMESILESEADLLEHLDDAFGFDADPGEFELIEKERGARVLHYGTRWVAKWPSYAAVVADVAAGKILGEWIDEFDEYEARQRGQILNSLRMFLEVCPTAEGGVRMTEDLVESCCSENTVIAVICEETGERIFEHQVRGDARQTAD